MQLYTGHNLDDYLKLKTELKLSVLLSLFLKVCDALIYAHQRGILHLDVKASNIKVSEGDNPMLCDWGISKFSYLAGSDHTVNINPVGDLVGEKTLHGLIQGTPGYMAPEQKHPNEICDERTDVYSLGVLLSAILTGKSANDETTLIDISLGST